MDALNQFSDIDSERRFVNLFGESSPLCPVPTVCAVYNFSKQSTGGQKPKLCSKTQKSTVRSFFVHEAHEKTIFYMTKYTLYRFLLIIKGLSISKAIYGLLTSPKK